MKEVVRKRNNNNIPFGGSRCWEEKSVNETVSCHMTHVTPSNRFFCFPFVLSSLSHLN